MSYNLSMVALSKSILKWVKDQMKEGSEGRAVANVKMSRDTTWYIIHVCNTSPTNRYM